MPKKIVAYVRVSTDKQGKCGLGLESERERIVRFADTEVVTSLNGSKKSRPARDARFAMAAADLAAATAIAAA